ncbi:hypothetical protein [Bifidobacterium stellenboschense]|uniref:Uncharacterized protein n=1 Tax=Bifidobacterium stellenboschense TaxID=762211 RepID=A0A087DPK4_9BIFI|nr:hypothetical protein [Bifidobacterium stellenboschense]KFI97454.1 hypothetical protein BSTEL_0175 [Bifidobacterium stellenboschense]
MKEHDRRRGVGVVIAVIIVLAVVGLFAFARWWSDRPGDIAHARYTYSASDRFTRKQLDAAGKTIANAFTGFGGCTLDKVAYDETRTDRILDLEDKTKRESPSYSSSIYEAYKRYGRDRILMADVDFTCDGFEPSLSRGPQSMTWYLLLDDDGETWTEIDHGNG